MDDQKMGDNENYLTFWIWGFLTFCWRHILMKLPKWNLIHAYWPLLSLFVLRSSFFTLSTSSFWRFLLFLTYSLSRCLALLLFVFGLVLHYKLKWEREEKVDRNYSRRLIGASRRRRRIKKERRKKKLLGASCQSKKKKKMKEEKEERRVRRWKKRERKSGDNFVKWLENYVSEK